MTTDISKAGMVIYIKESVINNKRSHLELCRQRMLMAMDAYEAAKESLAKEEEEFEAMKEKATSTFGYVPKQVFEVSNVL